MEGSPWRVVRGVVRRVVRGAGSVGSPRIGGQSFLLSHHCRHDFRPRAILFFLQIQDTILWLKKPFKIMEFSLGLSFRVRCMCYMSCILTAIDTESEQIS